MVLRTAVIGAGTVSENNHLPAVARNPRTALVAVCDADESQARRAADEYGGRAYTDADAMIGAEPLTREFRRRSRSPRRSRVTNSTTSGRGPTPPTFTGEGRPDETYRGEWVFDLPGGEFVLTVELPGFDRDEIEVSWYEGCLNISAEHEDSDRGQKRTYHRSFRMPKAIEDDDITARYENGVLEVRLPAAEGATARGKTIELEG